MLRHVLGQIAHRQGVREDGIVERDNLPRQVPARSLGLLPSMDLTRVVAALPLLQLDTLVGPDKALDGVVVVALKRIEQVDRERFPGLLAYVFCYPIHRSRDVIGS